MFIQLKTGYNTDRGPAWISLVRFNRSYKTAYWHGKTLRRWPGMWDANFYDVDTNEEYWVSGPHRDRADTRYSNVQPVIDDDARGAYEAFLAGAPLPGRRVRPLRCATMPLSRCRVTMPLTCAVMTKHDLGMAVSNNAIHGRAH